MSTFPCVQCIPWFKLVLSCIAGLGLDDTVHELTISPCMASSVLAPTDVSNGIVSLETRASWQNANTRRGKS